MPPSVEPFKHPWLGPFGRTYNVFSFVNWPRIYYCLCNSVIYTVAVTHNCSNLFYWRIWLYKQTLLTAVLCTKVDPTDWTMGARFAEGPPPRQNQFRDPANLNRYASRGGVWPKHETTLSPKCVKCYFNYPHDTVLRHRYNVNSEKQSSHRLKPYGRWRWKRTTNSRHTLNRLSEPVFFRGGRSGAVEAGPFSTFPWLSFRRGGGSHFLLKRTNHSTWQLKYD